MSIILTELDAPNQNVKKTQELLEGQLVELCDDMMGSGLSSKELGATLLFALHYLICQKSEEEAQSLYGDLLCMYKKNMSALGEVYELAED